MPSPPVISVSFLGGRIDGMVGYFRLASVACNSPLVLLCHLKSLFSGVNFQAPKGKYSPKRGKSSKKPSRFQLPL